MQSPNDHACDIESGCSYYFSSDSSHCDPISDDFLVCIEAACVIIRPFIHQHLFRSRQYQCCCG